MDSESHIVFAAGVIVLNDRDEILLVKRKPNVHPSDFALWTRPIGKVEFGETGAQSAARETLEETGVTIKITKMFLHDVAEDIDSKKGRHCVTLGYLAKYVSGEAQNMEPEKHDAVQWFALTALPEDLSPNTLKAIRLIWNS